MELTDYRERLDTMKAEHGLLGRQLAEAQDELTALTTEGENLEKARAIVQQAALQTQENLRVRIESLVTTALKAVFQEKNLSFHVEFDSKRGRTECVLTVAEDGNKVDPMLGHGGGPCDIASFALRCAFWSLKNTRGVLILDEPMKFLSRDLIPLAADMIKMIASELGLQIIMVTHVPEFIEIADKDFTVVHQKGVSKIVD